MVLQSLLIDILILELRFCAKGLDFEWCKQTENGLLKPDIIIYLTGTTKNMASRHGYGSEIYERMKFKIKLKNVMKKLIEVNSYGTTINADQDILIIKNKLKLFLFKIFIRKQET